MWLKACLNGPRPRESSLAVPILPAELAHDRRNAVDAGAVALHLYPRIVDGKEIPCGLLQLVPISRILTSLCYRFRYNPFAVYASHLSHVN